MLPSGSAPARAFHKAALAGVLHEKKTNPSLDVLLPVLASPNVLELLPSPEARANVRLAHKEWELQKKKSKEMTAREAALEGRGYAAWVTAREKDDFHHGFLPVLQDIVALKKEVATATRPGWDTYDANLDLFEPGMTVRRLTEIFGALKTELVPLLQQIMVRVVRKILGGVGNIPERDEIFLGDSWGHWGCGGMHAPAACRGHRPPTASKEGDPGLLGGFKNVMDCLLLSLAAPMAWNRPLRGTRRRTRTGPLPSRVGPSGT